MDELDDAQQARLFDALLDDAARWQIPPRAQARRAAQADDAVAEDLALVVALREVRPSRSEVEKARARGAQRLAAMMRAESPAPTATRRQTARAWLRAVTSPPRPSAQQLLRAQRQTAPASRARIGAALSRIALVAMALLTLAFGLLAGASAASAQALPESGLYRVKRAEEAVLLALSWSNDSKGQTLTMIASHRIIEASTEASQQRTAEARALLGEFDAALGQLIDLTAQSQASHQDTSSLTRAVQATLETEQNAATQAASHGETSFAQAATAGAQAAVAHIKRVGIKLPGKTDPGNGTNNGNGAGNGSGNTHGKPQQTPGAQATHTPRANSSNGGAGSSSPAPTSTSAPNASGTPSASKG